MCKITHLQATTNNTTVRCLILETVRDVSYTIQYRCSYLLHMNTNTKDLNMQNNHHSNPTAQLQGLENFVQSVMQEWKVRGVALAVVKNNEIIYMQGFGLRDEARGLPVTQQTLFPIASCTKGRSGLSIEFQSNASDTVTGMAATMPDGV